MTFDALSTSLRLLSALVLPPILGWMLLRVLAGGELVLSRLEQAVAAWTLGWGILTLAMFFVGLVVPPGVWHPLPLLALWLIIAILLVQLGRWQSLALHKTGTRSGTGTAQGPDTARPFRPSNRDGFTKLEVPSPSVAGRQHMGVQVLGWVVGALVLVQCAAVALQAMAWPVHDPDAWSIWAFKARIFYVSQSIPAPYFGDLSKLFSHPDYPLLLPLAETWLYGWLGRVDDWMVMVLAPLFFAAVLAWTGGILAHLHGKVAGWVGALALACIPFLTDQGSAGDADVPLALMALGSVAFLLRWLRAEDVLLSGARRALVLSGVLAGLGAWTKKEGSILLCLMALIVVVASFRRHAAAHRWRAMLADCGVFVASSLATAGPWLIFLIVRRPLTRDFLPITVPTLLTNLNRLPTIGAYLAIHLLDVPRWNVLWLLLAAAVVLGRRRLRHGSPAAYLLVLLLAQVASDGAIFIFSDWQPYTLHMQTALDRLLLHSAPLAVLLIVELGASQQVFSRQPDR